MCSVFLHVSVDFDFDKYGSIKSEESPEIEAYGTSKPPFTARTPDQKLLHAFNWPHSCLLNQNKPILVKVKSIQDGKMDEDSFKAKLNENPFLEPFEVKKWATANNKYYKDSSLNRLILEFRKMKFPSDETQVLNPLYCKTLDQETENKMDFYQGKGEFVDIKGKVLKYIILGTKFSLRILSKSPTWFMDGTFKVVPKDYKQVYIWIAKLDEYNIPCLYIIMNSKSQVLYNACFSHIKNLFTVFGFTVSTTSAMLDYQKAPRNALAAIFPNIVCKDDYFHLCKCLWTNAGKLNLCGTQTLEDTILLIGFFKILIHVEKEKRKEYFADVKTYFLEKNQNFKGFIDYFEKNWLGSAIIDLKNAPKEDLVDRTNNICEGFNYIYNKHIAMKNPQLAKFIVKLQELEIYYRLKTMKKIGQGEAHCQPEGLSPEKLPFTAIYQFLEKSLKQIEETQLF